MGRLFPSIRRILMSDWRLFNQDKFLQGKRLFRNHFVPTEQNDHEHCCFCCEKIDQENPEAYCTTDLNDWICLQCYEDFKEQFQWQIEKGKG